MPVSIGAEGIVPGAETIIAFLNEVFAATAHSLLFCPFSLVTWPQPSSVNIFTASTRIFSHGTSHAEGDHAIKATAELLHLHHSGRQKGVGSVPVLKVIR